MSEFKIPNSKEEMEALRKSLVAELSDDDLDSVAGGNDDLKGKFAEPITCTCPLCGQTLVLKSRQDSAKHMTKCPGNPYK